MSRATAIVELVTLLGSLLTLLITSLASMSQYISLFLGSTRETPQGGPFLTVLVAFLTGTSLRGSISPRVPLRP